MSFSIFVVYGTTFPFNFDIGWHGFHAAIHRVNWLAMGGRPGDPIISDLVQNVLLFLPFGFLGYFSLVYKSSTWKKLAIVSAGASLSAFVEILQLFSSTRFPSLSDVITNTTGTILGLLAAMALKRTVLGFKSQPTARRFLDAESAFPAFIFLVLTVAGCWQPFDFSLDVGVVWGHLKPLLREPIRFSNPDDDLITFIRFLLTTLFVCRMIAETGFRRPVLWGVAFTGSLAVALELSQVFVQSRSPEAQDALVAVLGAVGGGISFFFPGFHRRPRLWLLAGGLAILASVAARALFPYTFTPHFSGFNWILFLPQYERTTFAALGDFIESAMVFFPLGFLMGYFYPRIRPSALAGLLAGIMAMGVEMLQGFVPGRYADVTDVLGAMLGAIAGGLALTRGWPAFREYMARDDDSQV
ncbi:MAG: hypothetical protein JWP91_1645 [Fibrobacteres bacterium]|nr:hypothetical protein [Fibrobacterota bacterium]